MHTYTLTRVHRTASQQPVGSTACKAGGSPPVLQTQPQFRQVALGLTVTLLQVRQSLIRNGTLAEGLLPSGSLILCTMLSIYCLKGAPWPRSVHFDSLRFDFMCVFLTFPVRLYVSVWDREFCACDRICSFRLPGF